MKKHEFLQKIDSFKDCTVEPRVLEVYEAAENLFEEYEDEIKSLKDEISTLNEEVADLKYAEIEMRNEIAELSGESHFELEGIHDNIVTEMVIESLFENLDHIPVTELESFINQHKKY